jgi:hypothetical protein
MEPRYVMTPLDAPLIKRKTAILWCLGVALVVYFLGILSAFGWQVYQRNHNPDNGYCKQWDSKTHEFKRVME